MDVVYSNDLNGASILMNNTEKARFYANDHVSAIFHQLYFTTFPDFPTNYNKRISFHFVTFIKINLNELFLPFFLESYLLIGCFSIFKYIFLLLLVFIT